MSTAKTAESSTVTTTDRDVIFERFFHAPPALVFAAWTTPEHMVHWYGPNGFTTTVHEIDLRPGGIIRLTMRGPDGRDYHNRMRYLEVDPPHKLVYRHEPDAGDEPVTFESTLTFTAENNGTRLHMRQHFPTAETRTMVAEKYGAIEGGKQTFARLAAHIEPYASAHKPLPLPEMHLVRTFAAPRELVFAAWTEPAHLREWWGPEGFTNPRCEIDLRVGGAIRIDMRGPDGVTYPMDGEFHEITPPSKLAFLTGALGPDGKRLFEVMNTVTFTDLGERTQVAVHARVMHTYADVARHLRGMNTGWGMSQDRLATYLAALQNN